MDNTQQLFFAIIYLKMFVLAVVVALPSYMLKVPIDTVRRHNVEEQKCGSRADEASGSLFWAYIIIYERQSTHVKNAQVVTGLKTSCYNHVSLATLV